MSNYTWLYFVWQDPLVGWVFLWSITSISDCIRKNMDPWKCILVALLLIPPWSKTRIKPLCDRVWQLVSHISVMPCTVKFHQWGPCFWFQCSGAKDNETGGRHPCPVDFEVVSPNCLWASLWYMWHLWWLSVMHLPNGVTAGPSPSSRYSFFFCPYLQRQPTEIGIQDLGMHRFLYTKVLSPWQAVSWPSEPTATVS